MAKLFLVGSYSQKGLTAIVSSGFDRHTKTRKAVEDMGLKFISYDIVRGKYDFVVTVEGEWEQAVGLAAAANASGDMDEALVLECFSIDAFNKSLGKAGAWTPPSG